MSLDSLALLLALELGDAREHKQFGDEPEDTSTADKRTLTCTFASSGRPDSNRRPSPWQDFHCDFLTRANAPTYWSMRVSVSSRHIDMH
jgi:hypothetical protein